MKLNKFIKNTGLFFALVSLSFSTLAQDKFPETSDYWLRAAPPNSMMQAAYIKLSNNLEHDMILTGAYSPAFKTAEIHKTIITDGVARMVHQPDLLLKKGQGLELEPGGLHIMLMQPIIQFQAGDEIKINLLFTSDKGKSVQEIWFPVIKK